MGDLGDRYLKNRENALEQMIEEAMGFAKAHKDKEILLRGREKEDDGIRECAYFLIKYANSDEANAEEYGFYKREFCHCDDCYSSQVTGITYKLNVFRVTDENEKTQLEEFVKKFQEDESPNEKWFYEPLQGKKSENLISIYADFQADYLGRSKYDSSSSIDGIDVPLDIVRSLVVSLVD